MPSRWWDVLRGNQKKKKKLSDKEGEKENERSRRGGKKNDQDFLSRTGEKNIDKRENTDV